MFKGLIAIAVVILVAVVGTATAGTGPTAQGLRADGLRWQGLADRYERLQGLKADGLRWQAVARMYQQRVASPPIVSGGSPFQWGDAGIGAVAGVALAGFAGAAIVFVRRSRRTKLAL